MVMKQETAANALAYHCATCSAQPGQQCVAYLWQPVISKTVTTEPDGIHRSRKLAAARAVTRRLRGSI